MPTLRITFEGEGMAAQTIVVDCPHGVPQQLARPMGEEAVEDALDYIRTEVRQGNFSFARMRFGKDSLIPARKELLNGDS